MKKLSFLFALAILTLAACKKSEGPQRSATYQVNGVTDLEMNETGGANFMLWLEYKGILQERVTLSYTGLPKNVTAEFRTNGGTVPFSTEVLVMADGATPGTYPVKLVCNGSASGETTYDVNLKINPTPCVQRLNGSYLALSSCMGATFNSFISQITDTRIYIYNLGGMSINVYADVDCATSTFSIPAQSVSGYTITGSGSFVFSGTNASVTFQYDMNGPFPISCSGSMTK